MTGRPAQQRRAADVRRVPTKRALLVAVLLLAGYAAAGALPHEGLAAGSAVLTYFLAVWGASAFAWWGARRSSVPLVPALVALGVTLSALGDSVWSYLEWVGPTPDASVADVFYVASYVAIGGALLLLLLRTSRGAVGSTSDAVIDALTVVVMSVMVMWMVSIQEIIADTSVSHLVRVVWAAYPVLDAVLLALAIRLLASRPTRSVGGVALAAGAVVWFASDTGYLMLGLTESITTLLELGWMLGTMLLACAAWIDLPDTAAAGAEPRQRLHARVGIAVLPLLVPPLLELVQDLRHDEPTTYWTVAGMAVLVALAYARMVRALRAQQALREEVRASERRFAALAANSSDAVVVVAADGRVLQDSPQVRRLLGGEASSGGTRDLGHRLEEEDRRLVSGALSRSVSHPEEVVTTAFRVAGDDGRDRWLAARMVNLIDDPDVGGIVASLSDVTVHKELEQELAASRDAALEASRAKSAFLANMSHEIRTPMNGVIGLTELLLTTPLDTRQAQYAEGIRGAGDALLTIINDILDFSKVEAGHLTLEEIDFDVSQVVEEVGELVAKTAAQKGLELLAYCSPEVPLGVRGDPSRIRQVLLNLTANAVKFTEDGEVVVSVHQVDTAEVGVVLEFEVTDTGIGLDEADAERLFAPFSQADSSTTRKYGGTGLGLAISAQLVAAMHGSIGVRSRPGAGSTFWFRLPLALAADPSSTRRPADGALAGLRALVVDDNPTNRLILTDQLEAWGMRTDAVPGAAEALRLVRAATEAGRAYDIALLDLCMPEVDGLSLARQLTADDGVPPTPMVLLTSLDSVDCDEATAAGIATVLTKPVRMGQLLAAIETQMASRRTLPPALQGDGSPPPLGAVDHRGRGHVLVVEDNVVNQMVAVGILEHLGFTAEVAADGTQALEALEKSAFAAVLMDCQMPVMDGYEATGALRRLEGTARRTPVIAMTAGAVEGDRERCLDAGMDDYVSKPVSPADLESTLARWVPSFRV